jgi:hypothetical protein
MRTKQPTIEDIYMADAFMTTPGIRQGLLERASEGNDDEVMTEDTDDGPVVYYRAPHGEMYPVGRPIMLAAGPSGTRTDAPAGATISPTPRNPVVGGVADFVRGVRDMANQYEIKDWVPLLGKMGVGDLLLGKSPEEIENWAYGNSPIAMPPSGTGGFVPVVKTGRKESLADTVFLGVDAAGLAKGAGAIGRGAVKGAARAIDQAMVEGTGPAARLIPDAMRPMNVVPPGPSAAPARAAAPVSDMGFYSAVEQAALNTQRKSGPGQAFLNDILKGENVKSDEVKWIGLDEFLKGKKNVTREEVQQFIAANKVDLQEVRLGESGGAEARFIASQDIGETLQAGGVLDDDAQFALKVWRESAPGSRMESQNAVLLEEKLREAGDNRTVAEFLDAGSAQTDNTRYGTYTLPGGENYREILLTMPSSRPSIKNMSRAEYNAAIDAADKAGIQDFRSTHWNQPNVLAHLRVNDRVDADGKKMLLIEEVQSDWHQAGRDKGYRTNAKAELPEGSRVFAPGATDSPGQTNQAYTVQIPRAVNGRSLFYGTTEEEALSNARSFIAQPSQSAVPDAPMKDTWYQLALKRALKYAADNGYERVGITTGARQAERYDLSKQVEEITVPMVIQDGSRSVRIEPVKGSTIKLMVDAQGAVTGFGPTSVQFSGKKLNEVIGKELAEKVMAAAPETKFTGLDLSVGGEGMKKYYDEVYPQFLAKYGKKWDAKVGQTTVNIGTEDKLAPKLRERGYDPETVTLQDILSENNGRTPSWLTEDDVLALELGYELTSKGVQKEPIRYIDITPQMRESVGKGQPLFTAVPAGTAAGAATMQDKEQK